MKATNWTAAALAVVLGFLASSAHAQDGQEVNFRHGLGYVFAGPTVVFNGRSNESVWQVGGGGEYQFTNGLGIGSEVGVISEHVGQWSVNPYFHFQSADRSGKFIPFVTAGYTGTHNLEDSKNWFNVGGGVDYWIKERIGVRFEARHNVDLNHSGPRHYTGLRVGFAWR